MSNTKDNNKNHQDNQAQNAKKNVQYLENLEAGKHSYSKQPDHK
jgi:hypothetical protein